MVFDFKRISDSRVGPFTMPPSLGPLDEQDVEDWLDSMEYTQEEHGDAQTAEGSCLKFITCTAAPHAEGSCLEFLTYNAAGAVSPTAAVETPHRDAPTGSSSTEEVTEIPLGIAHRRSSKRNKTRTAAVVPHSDHPIEHKKKKRRAVVTVHDPNITKSLRHVVESFNTPYLKSKEIKDIAKVLGITDARVRNFCNNYRKRYSFYNNNTKTPAIRQQGDLPTRSYVQFMTENIAVTTQTVAGLSCCDELQCTVCLSMGSAVASQTMAGFSWCEGTQCTVCFSDGSAVVSQTMAGFPWCESDATVHSGDPGEADGLPR